MIEENGPLWKTLALIQAARNARAEDVWRHHRDKGFFSEQEWWEGYADGLEDAARLVGLEVRR